MLDDRDNGLNGKRMMLIVDDSNIIRRRIERSTHLDGLTIVGTAKDGAEAIRAFKIKRPDVVTMDLTMPEMNGIECIEQIVSVKPDVLILVISALADKATAIEALKKGANGFLCKPFTDKELNAALAELLRGAGRA